MGSVPFQKERHGINIRWTGDEHNRRGDEALKGIENVVKVVEDVLIFDNDFDAHVERVGQVLLRCHEAGKTIHPKKICFR